MFKKLFSRNKSLNKPIEDLRKNNSSGILKKINPKGLAGKIKNIAYIPKVLSKTEKIIVLVAFVCILGSIIYIAFTTIPSYIHKKPAYGGLYIEGVVGQPQFINPILAPASDSDLDITRLVYSSLLKYDENQELVLDLAENYEISEDQKNYTFYIKSGIKWHDGEEITANDIVFTVQTIKNPEYQSPLKTSFSGVAVEKIDDYTVQFTLTGDTFSPFLMENTTFGIIPQHIWQDIPPKSATLTEYNLEPVGSGPYQFKEYKKDKKTSFINSYSLTAFENYFDKKPYIEEITFNFYDEYPALISAYNKKEVKGISYLPSEGKESLKKEINEYTLKLPRYYAIFFNEAENNILANTKVRQAIAHSIDKQKIIDEVMMGQGMIVDSPILPGFLGYNPEVKKYEYDPEKARTILEEQGWKIEDQSEEEAEETEEVEEVEENAVELGNFRYKDNVELEITLTYAVQPEFSQIFQIISENLKEVGINIIPQEINSTSLQSEYIRPRKYEALIYGQLISHDPDPYPFWHSSQREDPGLNLTAFKNNSVDNLLEEARKTSDEDERVKKYLHFQNVVANEVPAILLYSPTYLYGVNKKIEGINLEYVAVPSDRFANIANWYIKTDMYWKKPN
ncbi:MAG: hypothetical protein HQ538_04760 [Parcubacteria group bacterium]|nr:hypothetical protein [Parcubacteria group bacterium]